MEKMREEFESWAISCDMCTYFDDVEYRHQSTEWAWKSWKASRAALCVELPESCYGDVRLSCVVDSLDVSGVSYK